MSRLGTLTARVGNARPLGQNRGIGQNRVAPKPTKPKPAIGPARAVGGGGGAAPAGATAAAPPPQPGGPGAVPMPWDSRANSEGAGSTRKKEDTLAGLSARQEELKRSYGIEPGFENNPYSQASLLQRRHDQERRGNTNSAGLQLYSGSLVNHQAGTDFSYTRDFSQMKERYAGEQAQIERERQAAIHDWETAQEEAAAGAIERAEEAELEPEAVGSGGGGGGGGGGGKKIKKKSGGGGGGGNKPKPVANRQKAR